MSLRRRAVVVATGGAPAPRRLDTVLATFFFLSHGARDRAGHVAAEGG